MLLNITFITEKFSKNYESTFLNSLSKLENPDEMSSFKKIQFLKEIERNF